MARELPGRPGFVFGLEDEPFVSGYAALPAATTDADGAAAIPLTLPAVGPVSRPLALTATLRVRDGSGRPVERSVTRPLLPAAPLIGVRPLFEGSVDEGGTAGFEAIALGPDLAPADLAAVGWTLSRIETDFQWYEADGVWNYEPVTRRSRVANGTVDLAAAAPVRLDLPRRLGPLRADAGGDRRPLHRDEHRLRRRLGRGRGRLGDAGLPRAEPRPRSLCPRRHGTGADRRAEPRAAPGRGDGRPADREPHARGRGRRDGRRSAGHRGVGRRRLCRPRR